MSYKAVGVHVFAGGFTLGVQQHFDVAHQLEVHNFGLETATAMCGVECINDEHANWPEVEAQFAFANPRCTAFSTITSGTKYVDSDAHGPWAKQTCDIHQFCEYAAGRFDIVIWESVQQAFKVGRPLVDFLVKERFAPKGYRVAHVFVNAASLGNSQQRKRYFFVAYRDDRQFNITPPVINPYYAVLADAIWDMRNRETREVRSSSADYDGDCYLDLTPDEKHTVSNLPNGWDLNLVGKFVPELLSPNYREKYETRCSDMPFSMHGIVRLNWLRPSPTLHSSAGRFIHPYLDRPLTYGELSKIMGWTRVPVGQRPIAQMAKGVVPVVGEWLGAQAKAYLDNAWGNEDWESSYDAVNGKWVGRDTNGALEKTFDLTRYAGQQFDMERYDDECLTQVRERRSDVARQRIAATRVRETSHLPRGERD